jgi:hypothetical protein
VSAEDDRTAEPAAAEPAAPPAMHPAVRWLARLAVVAVALRFIVQGLQEQWSGADEAATGFLYLAVVLGVVAAGWAVVELIRRGRGA